MGLETARASSFTGKVSEEVCAGLCTRACFEESLAAAARLFGLIACVSLCFSFRRDTIVVVKDTGFSGRARSSGCIGKGTSVVGYVSLLLAVGTPGSLVDPGPCGPPCASGHFFAWVGYASWGGVFGMVLRV